MLLNIALFIVILVVAVLLFAATRPNRFRIARQTEIDAPPEKIVAFLDDFHRWAIWSPWEGLDPDMTRTHSGATRGKGAVYAWDGNKKAGQGRMEILEAAPASRILIKLDFVRPFKASNLVEFTLVRRGGTTEVIWAMTGTNQFMGKVMSLVMSMDKLIGKDFERGLENLKAASEAS